MQLFHKEKGFFSIDYIISNNLLVNPGATLTIEPGTIIKLEPSARLVIRGTLLARGTNENRILFTSTQNDLAGGDTNKNDWRIRPAPGDWEAIRLEATNDPASILEYCVAEYGGSAHGMIYIMDSSPIIRDSSIQKSKSHGVYVVSGNPIFTNVRIQDNLVEGVYINNGQPQILNSIFENQGGNDVWSTNTSVPVLSGNIFSNSIVIPAESLGTINTFVSNTASISVLGGIISKSILLSDQGAPYHIANTVRVFGTKGENGVTTLTIAPGVRLNFDSIAPLEVGSASGAPGALIARGTSDQPIVFSSSQASPAPGDWYGIRFLYTAAATSIMEHCVVEYAGSHNGYGAIYVRNPSVTIQDTLIQHSRNQGVYIISSNSVISNVRFWNNLGDGIYIYQGAPQILDSLFENQGGYDIRTDGPTSPPSIITGNIFSSNILIPAESLGTVNYFSNTSASIFVLGGIVSKDITLWNPGVPYRILGTTKVAGTDGEDGKTTLTIAPDVRLRFASNAILEVGSSGLPGALIARGTADQPILFTADQDIPTPGYWSGIHFLQTADSTSVVEHCIVEYAGGNNGSGIYVYRSFPRIQDTTVQFNKPHGIHIVSTSPEIINVTIRGNLTDGIYINGGQPQILNSVFEEQTGNDIASAGSSVPVITGNSFSGNIIIPAESLGTINSFSSDASITVTGGTISKDITLLNHGVPYIFTGRTLVLGTDEESLPSTLTIAPGTHLHFGNNIAFEIGSASGASGALIARGTTDQPILFTSNQTVPFPGDWSGIQFLKTAANVSIMEHCMVEYAGSQSGYGAVFIQNASPTIEKVSIRNSKTHGLRIVSGNPVIREADIRNNIMDGVYIVSGQAQILNSIFENQGGNDITTAGSAVPVVSGNTFSSNIVLPPGSLGPVNDFSAATSSITVTNGTISKDVMLLNHGVPYYITGTITVLGTDGEDGITTLAIAPGASLHFSSSVSLDIGSDTGNPGALLAVGTNEEPIIFTSNQSSPLPGSWIGIRFHNRAADTSALKHCIVEYAGSSSGALHIKQTAPTIQNTIVQYSKSQGIYIASGNPRIMDTILRNNQTDGIYIVNSEVRILDSVFENQGGDDIMTVGMTPSIISGNAFSKGIVVPAGSLGGDNEFSDNASIMVTQGTITKDTVLKDYGPPYRVTGRISVTGTDGEDSITTLTIASGTRLHFTGNTSLEIGLTSGNPGALIAEGTAEKPVVFTSDQASPASGDWIGFRFHKTAANTSVLDHCIVEYAGSSGGAIYVEASPTIQNSLIRSSKTHGIYITSGEPQVFNSIFENQIGSDIMAGNSGTPVISGNTFYGSVVIPAGSLGTVNTFSGDAASITVNRGNITKDITLQDCGIPYQITAGISVLGTDGDDGVTTLTIAPGTRLHFGSGIYLDIASSAQSGALRVLGTEEHPVIFSSNQVSPAPGNWNAIRFFQNAAATSLLDHCIVEYAGASNGAIYIADSSPTIQNSLIRNSKIHGIFISGGEPQILNSIFENQADTDITTYHTGTPTISGSTFTRGIVIPAESLGTVNTFSGNAASITVNRGNITKDITLQDCGVPYQFTANVSVTGTDGEDGITTLTIAPGTRLHFGRNISLNIAPTTAPGAIKALGSVDRPIVFTSNLTPSAPGDWGGIRFLQASGNASLLDHCIVEYGGFANGAIYTANSSPTIQNSLIRKNKNHGIYVSGGEPRILNSAFENQAGADITTYTAGTPVISGNTFTRGIVIPAESLGTINIFSGDAASITVNRGNITKDITLQDCGVPYQFTANVSVTGTDGEDGITTLTIAPGTRLHFGRNISLNIAPTAAPGAIKALGSVDRPIVFTSNLTPSAPGDWGGIRFLQASGNASVLDYCLVTYAGNGLYINDASPAITRTRLQQNTYGIYIYTGAPTVSFSRIHDNLQYGVYKSFSPMIDARNNWWGDATGPLDDSDDRASGGLYNPDGEGDRVSNHINYIPWISENPDAIPSP